MSIKASKLTSQQPRDQNEKKLLQSRKSSSAYRYAFLPKNFKQNILHFICDGIRQKIKCNAR